MKLILKPLIIFFLSLLPITFYFPKIELTYIYSVKYLVTVKYFILIYYISRMIGMEKISLFLHIYIIDLAHIKTNIVHVYKCNYAYAECSVMHSRGLLNFAKNAEKMKRLLMLCILSYCTTVFL